MTKRAIIYARVSTDEQAKSGNGLEYQIGQCQAFATTNGYSVIEIVTDDYTGKTAFRPGMNALLEMLTSHRIDVVIIHRTDRLGRRAAVQDLLEGEIEARGAGIEYVTGKYDRSTAGGRFVRRVIGAADELDYDNIVEKLREHKYEAARRGSVVATRAPYGYSYVKQKGENGKTITQLAINEEEAQIVRMLFEWCAYGGIDGKPITLGAISKRLSDMGVPTRTDSRKRKTADGYWAPSTVRFLLKSEVYLGRWHYRKSKSVAVPGQDESVAIPAPRENWIYVPVPAIIDESTYQAAQERLKVNKEQALAQWKRKYTYLFSGMITCAACKSAYCGNPGSEKRWFRYYCMGKRKRPTAKCTSPLVMEHILDEAIWPWIEEVVTNPDQVLETLQQRQQTINEQNAHVQSMIAMTDKLIIEKRAERERVMALYKKGKLDEERWEQEDAQCAQELVGYEKERVALEARLVQSEYTPDYIADVQEVCARIAKGLANFTREERRAAYELLRLRIQIAVEDGEKVAYVECELDTERLNLSTKRSIVNTRSRSRATCPRRVRWSSGSKTRRRCTVADRSMAARVLLLCARRSALSLPRPSADLARPRGHTRR